MPGQDRSLRIPSPQALAAVHKHRNETGKFRPTVSSDPVAGAVRASLLFAEEADGHERPRPGHPPDRKMLLRLLDIVKKGGYRLGAIPQPDGSKKRIGTAMKGKLVQEAARKMHLSPDRVRDLARQLADLAGGIPERVINAN